MRCAQSIPQTPAAASGPFSPPGGTGGGVTTYEWGLGQTRASSCWGGVRAPGAGPREESLGSKALAPGPGVGGPPRLRGASVSLSPAHREEEPAEVSARQCGRVPGRAEGHLPHWRTVCTATAQSHCGPPPPACHPQTASAGLVLGTQGQEVRKGSLKAGVTGEGRG